VNNKWTSAFVAFVVTSMFFTSVAFASSGTGSTAPSYTSKVSTSANQSYITLSIPNLNNKLQPAQSLNFTFTLKGPLGSGAATNPIKEIGTLTPTNANPFTYTIPLPNYGQQETVWVSTSYSSNGYQYTSTAGPLIDTLPEAPFAVLIPLGMLGIWYLQRRRRFQNNLS
jgi:hypothetical protein